MPSPSLALRALRELGPRSLALYASYRLGCRSGWLRLRTPSFRWEDRPLAYWLRPGIPSGPEGFLRHRRTDHPARFTFDPDADLAPALASVTHGEGASLLREAEEILEGRYRLFGGPPRRLGFPPDWDAFVPLSNGESRVRVHLDDHWSAYDVDAFPQDVKLIWEPSRFGWVFPLGRAYRLTGEARFAEGFWTLLRSWREANQPNAGPHWVSAQEVALRVLALIFAFYAFAPALAETPHRAVEIAEMIAVHALRIPPTMSYARAQGNNHLLTEAVALYSVGLTFPEFRLARRWKALGRRWVITALSEQVFPDGGYVQHSTNYHRLALQAGLWAAQLGSCNHEPLPSAAHGALRRLTRCLMALVEREGGRTPNFGPNDGALILPLTTDPFSDFRHVVQAGSVFAFGRRACPPGPWDEALVWLGLADMGDGLEDLSAGLGGRSREAFGGPVAIDRSGGRALSGSSVGRRSVPLGESAPRAEDRSRRVPEGFPDAGLYFLRGQRAWGMLRCGRFTSRPGHSDQLHLDLWWRGLNVAGDPGTYLYSGEPPWDNALMGAMVHNTVVVDGEDPMRRAGRFLWLNWAQGTVLGRWRTPDQSLEVLVCKHDGYRRLGVVHRRAVLRVGDDLWLVVDDLLGVGVHRLRLNWSLVDCPWRLEADRVELETPQGRALVKLDGEGLTVGLYRGGELADGGDPISEPIVLGWWSPTYAVKDPAITMVAEAEGRLPLRVETWFAFGDADARDVTLAWLPPEAGRLPFRRVDAHGVQLEFHR